MGVGTQVIEQVLETQFESAAGGRVPLQARAQPQLPPAGMAAEGLGPLTRQLGGEARR